jgi:hypothetical protein
MEASIFSIFLSDRNEESADISPTAVIEAKKSHHVNTKESSLFLDTNPKMEAAPVPIPHPIPPTQKDWSKIIFLSIAMGAPIARNVAK